MDRATTIRHRLPIHATVLNVVMRRKRGPTGSWVRTLCIHIAVTHRNLRLASPASRVSARTICTGRKRERLDSRQLVGGGCGLHGFRRPVLNPRHHPPLPSARQWDENFWNPFDAENAIAPGRAGQIFTNCCRPCSVLK